MDGIDVGLRDASCYRFGPYTFDPETLELRDASAVLALPRKPALLLKILLDNAGSVVTRDQIQRACWPEIRHGVDPRINAALRQIRRCLGDAAHEARFIDTLPRRGYRFVAEVHHQEEHAPSKRIRLVRWAVAGVFTVLLASVFVSTWTTARHDDVDSRLPGASRLAYAKARHLLESGGQAGIARSVTLFREVITAHPELASAHAGAASASLRLDDRSGARRFATRALELDPDSAEAHNAIGLLCLFEDWEFEAAEQYLRRASQLEPNDAHYRVDLALALAVLGRADEALSALDVVYVADPVEAALRADAGWVYYLAGAHERALELCSTAAELTPSAVWAEDCAQHALIELSRFGEAVARVRTALSRWGRDASEVRWRTRGSTREQLEAYWEWRVRDLESRRERSPYLLAKLYTGLGRNERALSALEHAVSANSMAVVAMAIDPAFEPLRAHPRFERLVRRITSGRARARSFEAHAAALGARD